MILTYNTLHKLPLGRYIDCVCDENYRALLVYNIPYSNKVLKALFDTLQQEYIKLSGNKEYSAKKAVIDDINDMKLKLYLYSNALQILEEYDDMQGAIQYLNSEGFNGTREQIIKRVTAEIKAMNIQCETKEAQLRVENQQEDKKKATREDYDKTILATNKNGYHIDENTTVAKFIIAMQMQREEAKRMEQTLNKRR